MNHLILMVSEAGLADILYDVFFALGFVSVFFFVVYYGKKMGIKLWKTIVVVLLVYPTAVLWMFTMYWIENGFKSFGGNNIVRIFVYVPLFGLPVARLLKIERKQMLSLLSFGPLLVHGVSHLGCVFFGCCAGYPSTFGFYNPFYQEIRFPIQPIEALGAVAIVVYLFLRANKRSYVPDGKEYPLMLVLFGSSRFCFEFLRDNEKLLFGCSNLAFHALFMFVVGILWLVLLKKNSKRQKKAGKTAI
jgi:hypothetical protein